MVTAHILDILLLRHGIDDRKRRCRYRTQHCWHLPYHSGYVQIQSMRTAYPDICQKTGYRSRGHIPRLREFTVNTPTSEARRYQHHRIPCRVAPLHLEAVRSSDCTQRILTLGTVDGTGVNECLDNRHVGIMVLYVLPHEGLFQRWIRVAARPEQKFSNP